MNRLLLKECLDELRSDDSVELTEAHNNRRKDKKKRGTRGSVPARHSRHLEPNLEDAPLVPPTPVDPNAEQNLASLAQRLAQGEHLSPVNFLREVCEALGYVEKQVDESGNPKKLNPNHSVYFVNQLNGREFHLRMANHRATVNEFARREEWENNTGIVLKMSDKPLIPDSRVDYIEYVFLPPLLIQEKKQDIVLGIIDWAKTGNYSGPIGDMKPGISRRRKPFKMKKPTFSNTPQPPATPPDEPGVKESLAKYFQGTQDMKYRLLKEAALRALKEADGGLESFMGRDPRKMDGFGRGVRRDWEEDVLEDKRGLQGKENEGNGIISYEIPTTSWGQDMLEHLLDRYWGDSDASIYANHLFAKNAVNEIPYRVAFKDGKLYAVIIQDALNGDDEITKIWLGPDSELYDDCLLTQKHSYIYDDY